MAEGCPERLDLPFLRWVWKFRKKYHQGFMQMLEQGGKPYLVLRSHQEIERIFREGDEPREVKKG